MDLGYLHPGICHFRIGLGWSGDHSGDTRCDRNPWRLLGLNRILATVDEESTSGTETWVTRILGRSLPSIILKFDAPPKAGVG